MAQEEVLIGVKVDTKQAQKSLGQLEKSINEVSKSTEKDVKELNTSVSSMTSNFSDGISEIGDSFGSLGAPLASAKQGVANLGKGFKALLANPVVLVIAGIVAGLTALYKAFTRSEDGANKMAVAFAYLEGLLIPLIKGAEALANMLYDAFTNPKQALEDFGNALVNNVVNRFKGILELIPKLGEAISLAFDLKFSEAAKVATNAVGKVLLGTEDLVGSFEKLGETISVATDEALKFAAANVELEKQEQKLVKLNRENDVALAKQLKDRELLMNIRDNELLSIEERIQANEDLNKIEEEQSAKSLEAANLAVQVANERIRLYGETTENLDALRDAEVELANVEADSAGRQNEYILNRQGLQREEAELARIAIDFELEKVNITEKSEEKKLQARIDALDKTAKLYGVDTAEYKEFTKQKELAELELSQYKKELAEEDAAYYEELSKKEKAKKEEERLETIESAKAEAEQLTNEVANAVFEAQAANIEREKEQKLNAVAETQNRELEIVNARLEKGLINEEQAEQQRLKIEEDAAKQTERIEKEALKKKQKADISQAVSNGAIAITKTLANLGFPLGAIAAAGVAAQTAIQVATIKSQKFEKGGMIEGNSHAEGGVPFTVDGVGGFEAEGGEVIINKRSAAMFRKELSVINQAGGGVKFANGGVVGSDSGAASSDLSSQLQELIEVSKRPTRAVVSETEITNSQSRISNIEARSSF